MNPYTPPTTNSISAHGDPGKSLFWFCFGGTLLFVLFIAAGVGFGVATNRTKLVQKVGTRVLVVSSIFVLLVSPAICVATLRFRSRKNLTAALLLLASITPILTLILVQVPVTRNPTVPPWLFGGILPSLIYLVVTRIRMRRGHVA